MVGRKSTHPRVIHAQREHSEHIESPQKAALDRLAEFYEHVEMSGRKSEPA